MSAEGLRSQISTLEKKQKKFDTQLSEQHALAEKNAQDRDQAEARSRQAETKALSLTRVLEELQDKMEEVDRLRKSLQVRGNCIRRVCTQTILEIYTCTNCTIRSTLYMYNAHCVFRQIERDSLVESKDDAGKNVHSLAKSKQGLEAQLEEQKQLLEEVEDELQVAEDARLRLEVCYVYTCTSTTVLYCEEL